MKAFTAYRKVDTMIGLASTPICTVTAESKSDAEIKIERRLINTENHYFFVEWEAAGRIIKETEPEVDSTLTAEEADSLVGTELENIPLDSPEIDWFQTFTDALEENGVDTSVWEMTIE